MDIVKYFSVYFYTSSESKDNNLRAFKDLLKHTYGLETEYCDSIFGLYENGLLTKEKITLFKTMHMIKYLTKANYDLSYILIYDFENEKYLEDNDYFDVYFIVPKTKNEANRFVNIIDEFYLSNFGGYHHNRIDTSETVTSLTSLGPKTVLKLSEPESLDYLVDIVTGLSKSIDYPVLLELINIDKQIKVHTPMFSLKPGALKFEIDGREYSVYFDQHFNVTNFSELEKLLLNLKTYGGIVV